jgi:hypothetical protein
MKKSGKRKSQPLQLSRIVDRRMVGKKTAAGRVDFSVCLDFVCVCVGSVVCGEFCDVVCVSPAVRYVRLFVNAQSEKRKKVDIVEAAVWIIINAITVT